MIVYGYWTDNKKPPVTYRFLNLSVILDLFPGVFLLSIFSRCQLVVPQPKCRYSFLFSEFLTIGPVPVLGHPMVGAVHDELAYCLVAVVYGRPATHPDFPVRVWADGWIFPMSKVCGENVKI